MDEKQSINSEEDASLEETLGASEPLFQPETEDNASKESKYRKKPVVIEAVQWDGTDESLRKILKLRTVHPVAQSWCLRVGERLQLPTLEGDMWASKGDWVICGVKGEIYPCKPDIFEATYEKVQ